MSKARDIADLDFNSPDIDGGNIDGATIGATTPAAGTFSGINSTSGTVQFNDGGASFDSSDSGGYPVFRQINGSAQLGLERTGTSAGKSYIGADSTNLLNVYNSSFAKKFSIDASGSASITGSITSASISCGALTSSGEIGIAPASGTAKLRLTSQGSGSEVFSVCGQIPGVSNTGFAIRNETDSRNDFFIDGAGGATFNGDITGTKIGLGGAPHATASLNLTNTDQHIRLNNGSELGVIALLSTGELDIWGHGNGETINFRTGSGSGTVGASLTGSTFEVGALSIPSQGLIFNQAFGTGVPSITMTGTANNGRGGAILFQESDGSGGSIANTAAIYSTDGAGSNSSYGGLNLTAYQNGITFATSALNSVKMKIDSAGHITTQHGLTNGYSQTSGSGGVAFVNDNGSSGGSIISATNSARGWSNFYVNRIWSSGADARFMQFTANGSGVTGYIKVASASTMTFETSSDYRLKENVVYDWDATTRLKQLKPARFNFILDGTDVTQDGFLAHEAQEVVPISVSGIKDGMKDEEYEVSPAKGEIYTPLQPAYVDEDGNEVAPTDEVIHATDVVKPETLEDGKLWRQTTEAVMGTRSVPDIQGMDHSKLVPLLVKTIQELEARITVLEAGGE